MKLLVITQAIDTENSVLGFFHEWVREFSKHVDAVEVICLEKGLYNLPANVRVHSLGKENGPASRLVYARRFLRLIRELKDDYDIVFVHMNEEYMLLGGLLWEVWKKPVFMWRNHKEGSWRTTLAVRFAKEVFCTSPFSYVGRFKKAKLMPVGIDTDLFVMGHNDRKEGSILSLGRIAPVKRLEVLLEACMLLQQKKVAFVADIYGDALPVDKSYAEGLKSYIKEQSLSSTTVKPSVRNAGTPKIYGEYDVFVNLTNTGSFDKTLFEAMACGALVITSNEGLREVVPDELFFKEYDATSLAGVLEKTLALPESVKTEYRKSYRSYVEQNHGLKMLIERLVLEFKTNI